MVYLNSFFKTVKKKIKLNNLSFVGLISKHKMHFGTWCHSIKCHDSFVALAVLASLLQISNDVLRCEKSGADSNC